MKSSFSRKRVLPCDCDDLGGETGEVRVARTVFGLPGERHERGAAWLDGETELCSDAIGKIGGAHLWNGEAAGGDDQSVGAVVRRWGMDEESVALPDLRDGLLENDADAGGAALSFEHGDDVACGAVAEELAEGLLVEGNAMLFDQCDEIARRVAGERGAGEVWIGGEESVGRAVEIGEIAAAAAGDEDLLADAIGMIENYDATAALTSGDGSHEAGCPGAEHQDIADFFVMGRWSHRHAVFLIMQPRCCPCYAVRVKRYIQSPPHHCG